MQELSQNIHLRLELRQYQIQRLEILAMSGDELAGFLSEAEQENPLIEVAQDCGGLEDTLSLARWLDQHSALSPRPSQNGAPEQPDWDIPDRRGETLEQFLRLQIDFHRLTPGMRRMVTFLLGNLENNGRLPITADQAAKYSGGTPEDAEAALALLRSLAPTGVCAPSLKECLLSQLRELPTRDATAERLAETCLDAVATSSASCLARKCGVRPDQIEAALKLIRSLDPFPGSSFYNPPSHPVRPDILVSPNEEGTGWDVRLCGRQTGSIHISSYYVQLLRSADDREAALYLHDRLRHARELAAALDQRSATLLHIGRLIVKYQRPFFDRTGPIQPLSLADLAGELECHESTVSRALRGKYLSCPHGTVALRKFISAAVGNSGVTNDGLERQLRRLIENEDKRTPMSDQHLTEQLGRQGLAVSRRTVAKYRATLGIPNAFARRVI